MKQILLWLGVFFCNFGDAAGVIRIGHVNSMTGPEATFGMGSQKGVELAVKEINEAGGIRGKKIELVAADDQGKPDEAVTALTKLITQNKVVAVVGEAASSRMLAMAPIAQQFKVPLVSPSATNAKVTEVGDYIFRVCFIDPFQGPIVAKFLVENLKLKKVAILRDVRNDYSIGLANHFAEALKKFGGEVVSDLRYSAGDVDFRAQLTQIRAINPQAIFLPGYYTDVGLIARQARELGLKQPLLGGDGWSSPSLTQVGGKALNGAYFADHFAPDDTSARVQDFLKRFKKENGTEPNSSSALGYDAAKVILDAIKRSPDESPKAIREALAKTKDFPGVTGSITINAERNAEKPAVMLKVENGAIKFHSSLSL